jgi:hypothetical protein
MAPCRPDVALSVALSSRTQRVEQAIGGVLGIEGQKPGDLGADRRRKGYGTGRIERVRLLHIGLRRAQRVGDGARLQPFTDRRGMKPHQR